MDAKSKVSLVREILDVFPDYDVFGLNCADREKLNEVAATAIRGIMNVDVPLPPVTVPPPPPAPVTAEEFVKAMSCKKIDAIKVFREWTNMGLKESKAAVEAIMDVFATAAAADRSVTAS